MRRVVCHAIGPIDDLVVEDGPSLRAGPGQVVVDVRAAGVNFVDGLFVTGRYQIKPPLPFVPGGEVAGVISGVGDGVNGISVGDRVIASCGLGGFAEQVVTGPGSLYSLPDGVSFEIGATVVQSYMTAVFALEKRTHVDKGEWVLVLGAGGGVGRACVDVARSLGARVIGVASSEEKRQSAIEAGAEAVIDSTTEDVKVRARELSGSGVDLVYDAVGGDLAEPALRALKLFGRYLVIGFAAGEIPRLPLNQVLLNNREIIGVEWGGWVARFPDENRVLVEGMFERVARGELKPVEPTVMPLERAVDALRDFAERRVVGKVALIP